MGIKHIIFDIDNTLYEKSCGIHQDIQLRLSTYVSNYLHVSIEEAQELRKLKLPVYGTTLAWITKEHNFTDTDHYMQAVHPEDPSAFIKESLRHLISSINVHRTILTNGPRFHAQNVLKALDIDDLFHSYFDIESNNMQGKPHSNAYKKALEASGYTAEETLFIDDYPIYLDAFKKINGNILLIDEAGIYADTEYPRIKTIHQLPAFLEEHYA